MCLLGRRQSGIASDREVRSAVPYNTQDKKITPPGMIISRDNTPAGMNFKPDFVVNQGAIHVAIGGFGKISSR